ncbi:sulfite exporter TauE/SafE family protein [Fodinibius sp. SL11]|uniref:sulfite exporter TauE/SafE family protein n=1 Tax=Fodinibius sp. SL11 TaxID=3425690 RepID=UPI003F885AAB
MEIWTALAIGFFGSFHCIGMCGPIALALPGKSDSTGVLIWGRLLYNMGRVVTYSILGIIFGILGQSIALAGLQQSVSIVLGIIIVIGALSQFSFLANWKQKVGFNQLFNHLEKLMLSQFKKGGTITLFIIGLLNGLLPCGFVYVGLAGSVTTGSIIQGSLFMILFGLGTIPAMMTMSLAPGFISLGWRQRINNFIPYLAVAFGVYLIYRGVVIGKMLH